MYIITKNYNKNKQPTLILFVFFDTKCLPCFTTHSTVHYTHYKHYSLHTIHYTAPTFLLSIASIRVIEGCVSDE